MVTTTLTMTREEFLKELDKRSAEDRARWPTIESLPDWHPAKKLAKKIEDDVAELAAQHDIHG